MSTQSAGVGGIGPRLLPTAAVVRRGAGPLMLRSEVILLDRDEEGAYLFKL